MSITVNFFFFIYVNVMLINVNKSEKKILIYVTVMVISLLTMAIFPKMSKLPYLRTEQNVLLNLEIFW